MRGEQANRSVTMASQTQKTATAAPTPSNTSTPIRAGQSEHGDTSERRGWGKREIPEKTRLPAALSGTISGIEPGSPWWEATKVTLLYGADCKRTKLRPDTGRSNVGSVISYSYPRKPMRDGARRAAVSDSPGDWPGVCDDAGVRVLSSSGLFAVPARVYSLEDSCTGANMSHAKLHSRVHTRASDVGSLAAAPESSQCYLTPGSMALATCFTGEEQTFFLGDGERAVIHMSRGGGVIWYCIISRVPEAGSIPQYHATCALVCTQRRDVTPTAYRPSRSLSCHAIPRRFFKATTPRFADKSSPCGQSRRWSDYSPTHGEPGSIPGGVAPGFSHVGIVLDDAAGRRIFSGFSRSCIQALFHVHLASHSSSLKTLTYLTIPMCSVIDAMLCCRWTPNTKTLLLFSRTVFVIDRSAHTPCPDTNGLFPGFSQKVKIRARYQELLPYFVAARAIGKSTWEIYSSPHPFHFLYLVIRPSRSYPTRPRASSCPGFEPRAYRALNRWCANRLRHGRSASLCVVKYVTERHTTDLRASPSTGNLYSSGLTPFHPLTPRQPSYRILRCHTSSPPMSLSNRLCQINSPLRPLRRYLQCRPRARNSYRRRVTPGVIVFRIFLPIVPSHWLHRKEGGRGGAVTSARLAVNHSPAAGRRSSESVCLGGEEVRGGASSSTAPDRAKRERTPNAELRVYGLFTDSTHAIKGSKRYHPVWVLGTEAERNKTDWNERVGASACTLNYAQVGTVKVQTALKVVFTIERRDAASVICVFTIGRCSGAGRRRHRQFCHLVPCREAPNEILKTNE
ncbi:hypothetical protein PR048_003586 [Dryococelus australis]|uniref:Uncharacterized protein n=1 Tax=Dryococelus australis TaxID=614101 RepID=A0ABQ9INK1_9NEOP|nr:hypothetical protein PR048_003586 [Dryococelus australis]